MRLGTNALTALLAQRIMGWRVGPDRYLLGGRQWKPRSWFQPTKRLIDALRLLKAANADQFTVVRAGRGLWSATVQISGVVGEATENSEASALTIAVARSLGLEV
jgi:hypothetical protein